MTLVLSEDTTYLALLALVAAAAALLTRYAEVRRLGRAALLGPVAGAAAFVAAGVRLGDHDSAAAAVLTAGWLAAAALAVLRMGPGTTLPCRVVAAAALLTGVTAWRDGAAALVPVAVALAATALVFSARHRRRRRSRSDSNRGRDAPGASGRVFLGLLLGVLAVEATGTVIGPGAGVGTGPGLGTSTMASTLLLGVPFLDALIGLTVAVFLPRSAHRRRHPHLLEHLANHGVPVVTSRRFLVALQVVLGSTAALLVHRLTGLVTAGAVAGAVPAASFLSLVNARPARPRAAGGRTTGRRAAGRERAPRWFTLGIGALFVFGLAASVPAALAMLTARAPVRTGTELARDGLRAASEGRTDDAAEAFGEAARSFGSARDRLHSPPATLGLAVPVLSPNLDAARVVSDVGERLAKAGERLARSADPRDLRIVRARVPIEALSDLAPELSRVADELESAASRIDGVRRPGLLPLVRASVDDVAERLEEASGKASRAAVAVERSPAILGADGTRRYLLLVQNNAESRGTGGLISHFGEVVARDGRLALDGLERVRVLLDAGQGRWELHAPGDYRERYVRFGVPDVFQNVNMSPDFPTVARVVTDLYRQATGHEVDGVISVDPLALAAMLRLTGPVTVAPWPDPITPDNVVQVTLRDAYDVFDKTDRVEFLGDVAREIVDRLVTDIAGTPRQLFSALGPAVASRHALLYLVRPGEQEVPVAFDGAGAVAPVDGDSLMVVTQNAAQNKVDYYLERRVHYDVRVEPAADRRTARVRGRITLEFLNHAPSSGHSGYAIGPVNSRFEPGESRLHLSVYTPLSVDSITSEGESLEMAAGVELDRPVYSTLFRVPAGGARTVVLDVDGTVDLGERGRYRLDLLRQPLLAPDAVTAEVEVPPGWSISDPDEPWTLDGERRRARAEVPLDANKTLGLTVEPD